MTLDHTSILVPKDKFKQCLDLYLAALKPLGYENRMSFGEHVVGLGCDEHPAEGYKTATFWLMGADQVPSPGFHFAFRAPGKSKRVWRGGVLNHRDL